MCKNKEKEVGSGLQAETMGNDRAALNKKRSSTGFGDEYLYTFGGHYGRGRNGSERNNLSLVFSFLNLGSSDCVLTCDWLLTSQLGHCRQLCYSNTTRPN